ncbi:MAG: tetratricopeptide repeat protein, partial [Candidatus Binatia bacterium]
LRVRARDSFIRARDLGDNSELVTGMIEGLPEDGSESKGFSDNAAANKLMEQGEAAFSSGKLDDALGFYQDALKIDPRCYFAALFAGDVYLQKEKYTDAEAWYQRAITIDPNIETAYRYSATPLMKQKKYDEARDRYVEAFITDPYNKLAASGIIQWGQATNTKLGHPKIDIPETTIGADGKSNTTINVNPLADDGSMAWIAYSATREVWKKDKFAKTYPNEKVYRHSLQEEADALRSVVSMARSTKPKNLNSQIQMIEKMDKDGVLEAYILMAVPDRDIAQEFPDYLRSNRDKLRKYVVSYVIEQK